MAEYFIQQKAFRFNARTLVQDKNGKNVFLLAGTQGKCGDTITLYDLSDNLLGSIQQTSHRTGQRFQLYQNYKKVATMQKIPFSKKDRYYFSKLHWTANGNCVERHYQVKKGRTLILEMFDAHRFRGDFYSLIIPEEENITRAILIAAVLDYWVYNSTLSQKNSHSRAGVRFGTNSPAPLPKSPCE